MKDHRALQEAGFVPTLAQRTRYDFEFRNVTEKELAEVLRLERWSEAEIAETLPIGANSDDGSSITFTVWCAGWYAATLSAARYDHLLPAREGAYDEERRDIRVAYVRLRQYVGALRTRPDLRAVLVETQALGGVDAVRALLDAEITPPPRAAPATRPPRPRAP